MNTYEIWVDLAPGTDDLAFARAVETYLGHLQAAGTVARWRLRRRKFGFGPEGLGEFNVSIDFDDLAQMDAAFGLAARRSGELEVLHADVYSRVQNFRSALYRDFPDAVREIA